MLQPFGTGIWLCDGPVVHAAAGFHYPTRMVLIRLKDGSLFVWSPVALTPSLDDQVAQLGPVAHVVAPNSLHDSFLADWAQAFPRASLHAAPGLVARRADLSFATELTDDPHPDWAGQIDQVVLGGNRITTEVVFFHRASGTTIFTDVLQHMPRDWYRGWRRVVAHLDLMTAPSPQVPRKFRLAFRNRAQTRRDVDRILEWPTCRLVMAHGAPVPKGGQQVLTQAFRWLRVTPVG